jgi:hypothetical protein
MAFDANSDAAGANLCIATGSTMLGLLEAGIVEPDTMARAQGLIDTLLTTDRVVCRPDLTDLWFELFCLAADTPTPT